MMLEKVKLNLRITTDAFDIDEVQELIDSAKADLKLSGVVNVDESDELIRRAIILYCKANFGYDNPDAERFQKSYEMLKTHLSLCTEYNTEVVV